MAGPYDYSINIPQPPAQNFLQSLTGIMQLRQMQEQSALQQQQAAIAQQNAAFQAQMQPLQLEAERARIGQIGQATATSAEALRQGKLTFEQAQQDRVRQMEQQAVAQAQQRELVGKFTSLPPNAPMSEIVPIANQLLLLPGGDKVAKQAMDNFDALQQEFQKASKTALVTATTQLQAGDVEGAKKTYSTFEQAVRNSAGTNPQLVQLADGIKAQKMLLDLPNDQGVNSAKLASVQMLSIIDPKAADTILKADEQAFESPLKAAQARLAQADATLKELKATGALDSEEKMKQENVMRSEFLANPFLRTFPIKKEAYKNIVDAQKNPIGDSAKIVAFIKLQDPGSVVSVTEKGQITSTTPIASLQALIKKFTNDGILDDKTRLDIDSQSKNIFNTSKAEYEKIQNRTALIAKRYGLNPDNIISVYDTELEQQPAPPTPTGAPQLPISTGNIPVAPSQSAEEARIRSMLRPAAGFGNTMTPSQIQPQGGTFQGTPSDVDAILKQFGVR